MQPRANRLAEALAPPRPRRGAERGEPERARRRSQFDTALHVLRPRAPAAADFETMTTAEFELAQEARRGAAAAGRAGAAAPPRGARPPSAASPRPARDDAARWRASRTRWRRRSRAPRRELPTLVVLLDISGSMERYARLLLHYVHGLTRRYLRVAHADVRHPARPTSRAACATATPTSRCSRPTAQVQDWKGGTRIASCLEEFNRLLGAPPARLERGAAAGHRRPGSRRARRPRPRGRAAAPHAHQIVWLNPLLRFDGFEPRAAGVRALLPHVDRFLPVHNLASLADLRRALRAPRRPASTLLDDGTPWNCKANASSRPRSTTTWAALNDPDGAEGVHRRLRVARAHRRRCVRRGGRGARSARSARASRATCSMTNVAAAERLHDQLRRAGRRGRLRQGLGRRRADARRVAQRRGWPTRRGPRSAARWRRSARACRCGGGQDRRRFLQGLRGEAAEPSTGAGGRGWAPTVRPREPAGSLGCGRSRPS